MPHRACIDAPDVLHPIVIRLFEGGAMTEDDPIITTAQTDAGFYIFQIGPFRALFRFAKLSWRKSTSCFVPPHYGKCKIKILTSVFLKTDL